MRFSSKTAKLLRRLLRVVPKRRKIAFIYLLPISLFSGIVDVLVLTLASRLFSALVAEPNRPSIPFADLIATDAKSKLILLLVIYILMNWIASFMKLYSKASQVRLKSLIWRDLSEIAQRKILSQSYEFFINKQSKNPSKVILLTLTRVCDNLVLPCLQLINSSVIVVMISIATLSIAKIPALILILSILLCYIFLSWLITPFVRFANRRRISLETKINHIVNETTRTILDVHLTNSEEYFHSKYERVGRQSIPYIWKSEVLPDTPRALIEPLGITLIFSFGIIPLVFDNLSNNYAEAIPFLATIAIASLKLTPPLQDSFRALTSIRAGLPYINEALDLLELPVERLSLDSPNVISPRGIKPKSSIILNNVSYQYPSSNQLILDEINMTIPVGARVAFVGKTGSGKTTLANQLLCHLSPSKGTLQIDGIDISKYEIPAWQACCSYVPQSINLLDSNILENVAYGVESNKIDLERVWESLEAAQIADYIAEFPLGLYTSVGPNGISLSGGQRQRIALARAFYRQSIFMVLDEATSALDNTTESDVMNAIQLIGRRSTIVIIAHRLSTIMKCDVIYEFEKGRIKAFGNYSELIAKSSSFRDMTLYTNDVEDKNFTVDKLNNKFLQ